MPPGTARADEQRTELGSDPKLSAVLFTKHRQIFGCQQPKWLDLHHRYKGSFSGFSGAQQDKEQ